MIASTGSATENENKVIEQVASATESNMTDNMEKLIK